MVMRSCRAAVGLVALVALAGGAVGALAGSTGCGPRPPSRTSRGSASSAGSGPAAGSASGAASGSARAGRSPVVVAFVVDQLSAWSADERVPKMPEGGFFARITREGTWVHALRYPYAITDTAPGHAALHTGKVPAESGVTINEIPDPETGNRVSVMRDSSTRMVLPSGPSGSIGASAAHLRVPTVADRLREARPDALVVSVSLKDRAALLPAGKKPSHALWFDTPQGSFVTSTAIEGTFPAWAAPLADPAAVVRARETVWTPLDATWLAAVARRDDAPGEGDLDGLGVVFPHRARSSAAFRATPMSDAMILALALAAVEHEHDPQKPTLLLVSLSASDVIGHAFGPDSWEAWDHFRRLDAALAKFLDSLEAKVGPVRVLLSGDHGGVSMPEARLPLPAWCKEQGKPGAQPPPADPYERPRCVPGGRLEPQALRGELRAESVKVLGPGEWVTGIGDGYVFLTPAGRALTGARRAALDGAIRRVFAEKHASDAGEVLDVRALAVDCPQLLARARGIPDHARPGEDVVTLVCRSWRPDAAGDYYVVPRYGSYFDGEIVPHKGSSHGTPHLYDRTVPLFARGLPGELEAGATITDPVDFSAYAALEAAFLGLDPRSPRAILDALRAR